MLDSPRLLLYLVILIRPSADAAAQLFFILLFIFLYFLKFLAGATTIDAGLPAGYMIRVCMCEYMHRSLSKVVEVIGLVPEAAYGRLSKVIVVV